MGESKEWGGGVLSDEVVPLPDTAHQVERNLHLVESVGFRTHLTKRRIGSSSFTSPPKLCKPPSPS